MDSTYSILISIILFFLGLFQIGLVFGLPIGEFAWGGYHKILPKKLRIASIASILIYILISLIFLTKTSVVNIFQQNQTLDIFVWVIAIYFTLGITLNLVSRSKKERYTMVPIVAILAILSWLIVL